MELLSSDESVLESPRWLRNFYQCEGCGTAWTEEWSCECNDRCPKCRLETEAHDSIDIIPDSPIKMALAISHASEQEYFEKRHEHRL